MNVVIPHDLTPTEVRLLSALQDGRGHPASELVQLLSDPMSGSKALVVALVGLRKMLKVQHLTVVSYRDQGNLRYKLIELDHEPELAPAS